jgi:hypothetical protein
MFLGSRGQSEKTGAVYDLVVVLVDAGAASEFDRYHREVHRDQDSPVYPGMDKLPLGVKI